MSFWKKIAVSAATLSVAFMSAPIASAQLPNIGIPQQGMRGFEQSWPVAPKVEGCADLIVKSVPGTWETEENMNPRTDAGMMGAFNEQLRDIAKKQDVTVDAQIVPYPAKFGGLAKPITGDTMTYEQSRDIGIKNTVSALAKDMDRCPDSKFAVGGFSQGADVAGDVMEAIAHDKAQGVDADKMVAGLIYADPKRAPSTNNYNNTKSEQNLGDIIREENSEQLVSDHNVPGGGIMGVQRDMGDMGENIFTFCLDGDAVCALPKSANGITGTSAVLAGDAQEESKTGVTKAAQDGGLNALDKFLGGDPTALNNVGDPIAIFNAFVGKGSLSDIDPQLLEAITSLAGTHGTENGHVGYNTKKVAPGNITPIQWGAQTLVDKVAQEDDVTDEKSDDSAHGDKINNSSNSDKDSDSSSNDSNDKEDASTSNKGKSDKELSSTSKKSSSQSTSSDKEDDGRDVAAVPLSGGDVEEYTQSDE